MSRTIYILAGEPSGDALGGELMAALRERDTSVLFRGVGGEEMARQGLVSLFPLEDIAFMGFGPVIRHLPQIFDRIDRVVRDVLVEKPAAVVLIDSQEFSRLVASRLRKRGYGGRIVQYVSPTVWAWRPGRARVLKRSFDRVMALLPFEPDVMASLGGPETVYVGHPLLNLIPERRDFHSPGSNPLVLLLPGSRRSELERMLPVFKETVELFARSHPGARFVLPAVSHLTEEITQATSGWSAAVEVMSGLDQRARLSLFARGDVALATSGTVALELALSGCPAVVTYRVSPLIWALRFLLKAPFVSLPNLVLGSELLPERLQGEARPAILLRDMMLLLNSADARRRQHEGLAELRSRMTLKENRRPQEAAAEAVLELI